VVGCSTRPCSLVHGYTRGADPQRECRHVAKRSQEELAHRAEIDRTYISALERCVNAASIDVVDRLARDLGIKAPDLLRRPSASKKGPR